MTSKTDGRLLGTWQSDRESTLAEWRFPKRITPAGRAKFRDIFGHLQVTYTRTRIRGFLRDYRFVQRYELLGVDSESVVIRHEDLLVPGTWTLQHIHFVGHDRYWISLGANREWFKRVDSDGSGKGRSETKPTT
jgi:hypothetical protein